MSSIHVLHIDVGIDVCDDDMLYPRIIGKIFDKYIERRRRLNETGGIVLCECYSYHHFLLELAPNRHQNHDPEDHLVLFWGSANKNHDDMNLTFFKKMRVLIEHNESKGTLDIHAFDGSIDNLRIFENMIEKRSN